MKKLLKNEICGFHEQYTESTDELKIAEKSKISVSVHT